MSLSDWEINTDLPAALVWSLDLTTPIVSTGSLLTQYTNSTANGTLNALPTAANIDFPEGFTAGKLRTIFKIKEFQGTYAPYVSCIGIAAMQGARNITGLDAVGKTFYALIIRLPEGLNPAGVLLKIIKVHTAGVRSLQYVASADTLAMMTYPVTLTVGSVGTLEFQWISDIPNLNGVYLIARTGTMTDYSDLTTQLTAIDFTSPLVTTVGEGPFVTLYNYTSTDLKQITFDNTTLYSLT